MSLESGSWIGDLVPNNPPGSDPVAQAADHLRLIKRCLKNSLVAYDAPVLIGYADASGVANAYTVTLDPAPTALADGMVLKLRNNATANTGASTLAVNAFTPVPIRIGSKELDGGAIGTGHYFEVIYLAGVFQLVVRTQWLYLTELSFTAMLDNGTGTGAKTFAWNTAPMQKITRGAATTWTFNPPAGPSRLILEMLNYGNNLGEITWPPNTDIVQRQANGAGNLVAHIVYDGTNYLVEIVGPFV